jgi:nucleotidyltransferase/DNA polymerase involved in DNA repair
LPPKPQPSPQQQMPRELPEGAPLAKREKTLPKFTLNEDAPVVQAPSIGPKTARRLEAVGVKTIADLLAMNADEGEQKIIALVRQYRAAGVPLRAIVAELARAGLVSRAGRPLQLTQVARIAKAAA